MDVSIENQESDVVSYNNNNAKIADNGDVEDGKMSDEIDRRHSVTADSIGKNFSAPDEYDYAYIAGVPNFYGMRPGLIAMLY